MAGWRGDLNGFPCQNPAFSLPEGQTAFAESTHSRHPLSRHMPSEPPRALCPFNLAEMPLDCPQERLSYLKTETSLTLAEGTQYRADSW